jgi:hypothetical protein
MTTRICRGVVVVVVLAGCAFHEGTDPIPGEDTHVTIVDDTAGDFAAGTRDELVVDPLGVLAPDAFTRAGLHLRAYTKVSVTATTSWSDLVPANLGAFTGERYGEMPTKNFGGDRPYGVGLTSARVDQFTLLYDGEIFLPDGPNTLQLQADDFALVEIDLGAIRPTLRAAYYDAVPVPLTFSAPHAGWYPIHAAVSDAGGNAYMLLSNVAGGVPALITDDRLRVRVTDATGVVVTAAADRVFLGNQPGSSVEQTLVQGSWPNTPPSYDLFGIGNINYGLRYGGQLRVDTAEPYTFSLDIGNAVGDYARLIVDGVPVAGHWPGGIQMATSAPIALAPGWHDLVLDFGDASVTAHVTLTMATPTSPAAPIAAARLRPVRTGGLLASVQGLLTSLVDAPNAATPGVAMIALPLSAPPDAVVDFVDFFFQVVNETRTDLTIALVQPAGSETLPLPATPPYDNAFDYAPNRTMLAGAPVASASWHAVFTDSVPTGSAGFINFPFLIASYHGGPAAPFSQAMSYVSAPHAIDGAGSIDAIRVRADLHGATMVAQLRTGDAASIDTAAWTDAPIAPAGPLVEYRLAITSDGWKYPTVDEVEIDYTIPAAP